MDKAATEPYSIASTKAIALAAIALVAAYASTLIVLGQRLASTQHLLFFPLALLLVLYLAIGPVRNRTVLLSRTLIRRILFVVAWGLGLAGVLLASPWLAYVSCMLVVLVVVYTLWGGSVTRKLLPAWFLMWTIIPWPANLDYRIIEKLTEGAIQVAGRTLDWAGYLHSISSSSIDVVPDISYQLDVASQSFSFLFLFIFLTALLLIRTHSGIIKSTLVLLSIPLWVLLSGVLRIVSVIVLESHTQLEVTEGTGHFVIVSAFFAFSLLFILSWERLMHFLIPSAEPVEQSKKEKAKREKVKKRGTARQPRNELRAKEILVATILVTVLLGAELVVRFAFA